MTLETGARSKRKRNRTAVPVKKGLDLGTMESYITVACAAASRHGLNGARGCPKSSPYCMLIKSALCGIYMQEISDRLTQKRRILDLLIDELAQGKKIEKNLQQQAVPEK